MKERGGYFEKKIRLQTVRQSIPFLNLIPDPIYFSLYPSGFYLPTERVASIRGKLERELNHFIMTYRRDVFNLAVLVRQHLCANVKGAELTNEQLQILQEQRLKENVSFVAYQNPLVLIDPNESELSGYYRYRGLL